MKQLVISSASLVRRWEDISWSRHCGPLKDSSLRLFHIFYSISLNSSQNGKCFRQKFQRKLKHTRYMLNNHFSENHAVYEITQKNVVEAREAKNDNTIWRMRVACWISKATRPYTHAHAHPPGHPPRANKHTEKYVIIISFLRQKLFLERLSMLRYTYIACLVFSQIFHTRSETI